MLKKRLKSHIMVEYKWMVLLKLLTLCMFIAAVYAFISVNTVEPVSANAAEPLENIQPLENNSIQESNKTADANPAVIKWMKDRSVSPEHVLLKIYKEALRHSHPNLILAICAVESNFNPGVESEKGAVGLMGVLPAVWMGELKKEGILRDREDLYLISNNIASGTYVLKKYLMKSKNIEDALYSYVGGDRSYADKVLKTLGEIHFSEMPLVSELKERDNT
jgi:soluble lytic murein transglycosylase-like protein